MSIEVDLDASDLIRAFEKLDAELDRSMRNAVGALAITGAQAAAAAAPPDRTGKLRASIQAGDTTGTFGAGDLGSEFGAGAEYASFVEGGTSTHDINPKLRKALRFPGASGFVFRRKVRHPGTKAQPFVKPAADVVEAAMPDVLGKAIELAAVRAGLKG